jgi:hypothetical protein
LKKNVAWVWSEDASHAFQQLKDKLAEFPVLRRADYNKVFILHTNWSSLGIGAILGQISEEGQEYVIAQQQQSGEQLFFL